MKTWYSVHFVIGYRLPLALYRLCLLLLLPCVDTGLVPENLVTNHGVGRRERGQLGGMETYEQSASCAPSIGGTTEK